MYFILSLFHFLTIFSFNALIFTHEGHSSEKMLNESRQRQKDSYKDKKDMDEDKNTSHLKDIPAHGKPEV